MSTMNAPFPSISSRLAMFEDRIAKNAEQRNKMSFQRRRAPCRRRSCAPFQGKDTDDNESIQTAPTFTSHSTFLPTKSMQVSSKPLIGLSFDVVKDPAPKSVIHHDLVSLSELQPLCSTKQQGDDSFNSSLSTMDLTWKQDNSEDDNEQDESALFDSILQSSASRLVRSPSSRSVLSTQSMPCPSNITYPTVRNNQANKQKNLPSLMSLLDRVDRKKTKGTSSKKKSSRSPKAYN